MEVTLNGGPFDGRIVEIEDANHPYLYCWWMGDGYIRVYENQSSKFIYSKTVSAKEFKDEHGV